MKKSIVSAVILLAVLLGSCSGAGTGAQDSANSTDAVTQGAQTSAVSTEADTANVTTEESSETETPAAELTDMDGITEAENCTVYDTDIDLDKELEGYEVYEVTAEDENYINTGSDFSYDENNIDKEFALKFTDVPGLAMVIKVRQYEVLYNENSTTTNINSCIEKIFYKNILVDVSDILYVGRKGTDLYVGDDFIIFGNRSDIGATNSALKSYYYFIGADSVKCLRSNMETDEYPISIYMIGGKIQYQKMNSAFYAQVQAVDQLKNYFKRIADGYDGEEGENAFYSLTCDINCENGKWVCSNLEELTLGKLYEKSAFYSPTGFSIKSPKEVTGCETLGEFVDLYKQYVSEGKEDEFVEKWNLDE